MTSHYAMGWGEVEVRGADDPKPAELRKDDPGKRFAPLSSALGDLPRAGRALAFSSAVAPGLAMALNRQAKRVPRPWIAFPLRFLDTGSM